MDSELDNLVRDIMQVPYSKHKAKAAIQQLIDSAVREAEAKLEQAVLDCAPKKWILRQEDWHRYDTQYQEHDKAIDTYNTAIKQVFKEMK